MDLIFTQRTEVTRAIAATRATGATLVITPEAEVHILLHSMCLRPSTRRLPQTARSRLPKQQRPLHLARRRPPRRSLQPWRRRHLPARRP